MVARLDLLLYSDLILPVVPLLESGTSLWLPQHCIPIRGPGGGAAPARHVCGCGSGSGKRCKPQSLIYKGAVMTTPYVTHFTDAPAPQLTAALASTPLK